MIMENDHAPVNGLEPREPTVEDLAMLCRELNRLETVVQDVGGVPVPFASPRLLWRMKAVTHREKDRLDLIFLTRWFHARGEQPPAV